MQNDESVLKESLRRHLQAHKGQIFSYEMVRELMSFVSDMERNHPAISWVSEDSLVRLLNGIFKRVGQRMDDKSIAGIEESVLTALVFYAQNDIYDSTGRLAKQPGGTGRPDEPRAQKDQTAKPAAGADYALEDVYQRMLQELIIFENRITRIIEKSASESQDTEKKLLQEKKELESRRAAEYSAMESRLAKERLAQEARLAKERAEMTEMFHLFLSKYEERSGQTESAFDERMRNLESYVASMQAMSESAAKEQAGKWEGSASQSKSFFDAFAQRMDQKFDGLEEKFAASKRAAKRLTVLSVIGLAAMAAGFVAVIYFLK